MTPLIALLATFAVALYALRRRGDSRLAARIALASSPNRPATPWRAYLRWLRFQRAAAAIARGAALTDAAHEAGFHDAAHMTRTFKATYGLAPSQLRRPAAG